MGAPSLRIARMPQYAPHIVQATGCFDQPSFSNFEICSAKAWLTKEGAEAAAAEHAAPFISFLLVIERLTKPTDIFGPLNGGVCA